MSTFHNFILSTTPALDGYKIKKYYGTVTSHVVAGTGLFSDFAAGVSDIFGGRSGTYQKQLISIKDEVLKRLKDEATLLGANGIVGLRIDFDEISGKGKTMFMVSAIGTAVKTEFLDKKENDLHENGEVNQISAEKLNKEIKLQELMKSFLNSKYTPSNDDWGYITENAITEIFLPLYDFMNRTSKVWSYSDESYYPQYVDYLKVLPDEFLVDAIYNLIYADHSRIGNLAFSIIDERQLLNLPRLKKNLTSKTTMAKKYALKILYNCDKKFYTKEDLTEFEEIKEIIKNNFPDVGQRLSKKKLISSSEVENWICPSCKKENSSEDKFCRKCGSDIRGFFEKDVNPEDVIEDIDNKLEVLKKILKQ